jgi:hypothetical protein
MVSSGVGGKCIPVIGQQLHEFGVNESLFLTRLHFAQNTNGGQLFQVA